MAALEPRDTLEDMARGLAKAMVDSDLIERGLDVPAVLVAPQTDGYYRCYLDGATDADARRFAEALAELIEPLWDPRYICSRRLRHAPTSSVGTIRLLAGQMPGVAAAGAFVWHTVPTILTRRHASVRAFALAWRAWVSADGYVLRVSDPEAQAVLAARTGDDPFEVETQHRVLWT